MKLLTRKELRSLNIVKNAKNQYVNAVNSFHHIFLPLLQQKLVASGQNGQIIMKKQELSVDNIEGYSTYLKYRLSGKKNYILVKFYGIFDTFTPIILFGPESDEQFDPQYNSREDMKSYFQGGNPEINNFNNTEEAFSPEMLTDYINWITNGEVSDSLRKQLIENRY